MWPDTSARQWNFAAAYYAADLIPVVRKTVVLEPREMAGLRFKDDSTVMWRLESMFTDEQFGLDPVGCVDKALHECAMSDYWYEVEKKYEDEDTEVPTDDDD